MKYTLIVWSLPLIAIFINNPITKTFKYLSMKQLNTLFFLLCLFLGSIALHGQINPIQPSFPVNPGSLNICADTSRLTVQLVVFNSGADNATVRVTFPTGVDYVAGSLAIDAMFTNNGLSLVEHDITNLNAPVFRINPTDLTIADSLRFSIARYARCAHIGFIGSIIDRITISQDAGADVIANSPAYNILRGVLTPQYSTLGRDTLITTSATGMK